MISRIIELQELIIKANKAYEDGNPIMSDLQYDLLIDELKALHPKNKLLKEVWSSDSTDQIDWYDLYLSEYPMKSINLAKESHQIRSWLSNIPPGTKLHISLKEDGYSWRAVYSNGKLVAGYTRGRKTKGKDITRQLSVVLPKTINTNNLIGTEYEHLIPELETGEIEIRGELMLSYTNLDILRTKYPRDPNAIDGGYNNPRNSVASLLKDDTPEEMAKLLSPKVFKILGLSTETLEDDYKVAELLGFSVPEWETCELSDDLEENLNLVEGITMWFGDTYKDTIDFLTDGVVFAVNDKHLYSELGGDDKYDSGILAVKMFAWKAGTYISEVIDIEWSYNSKYISPVAIIEPVVTESGRTVQRIALKTVDRMQQAQAYPGNRVEFEYVSDMNPRLILPGEKV